MITYKIKDVRKTTNDKLLDNTNWDIKDLKFIVFEYLIPRSMGTPLKRYSKIYCLNKGEEVGKLGFKYIIYNYIVCYITGSIQFVNKKMEISNEKNKKGIDITNELRSKITYKDIDNGYLELLLPLYAVGFSEIDKEIKDILIANFKVLKINKKLVSNPLVGYVKNNGNHLFYIGLQEEELAHGNIFKKKLKKNFFFTTKFKFVNMDEEKNELVQLLLKDGIRIIMEEE